MTPASNFGHDFDAAWKAAAAPLPFLEVPLFRALKQAITSLSARFRVEEYHGSGHQVKFDGVYPWSRIESRCEISDLLVVTYRTRPTLAIRMSFIQAKRAPTLTHLCAQHPTFRSSAVFEADLEQWDLLARRPGIRGVGEFNPPANLLAGALLASVGSYCVFHRTDDGLPSLTYASADVLQPVGRPAQKHGRLRSQPGEATRTAHGYDEAVLACCPLIFGEQLYLGTIGTPLEFAGTTTPEDRSWREQARRWLGSVLMASARQAEADAVLARELVQFMDIPIEGLSPAVSPSTIILIKTDMDTEQ